MKKGQIKAKFPLKIVKITKLTINNYKKCMKFAHICPKRALKYTIFVNIQKRPKMAKPFYFWQTVSKKAKIGRFGL
jgi:hypothetical protein